MKNLSVKKLLHESWIVVPDLTATFDTSIGTFELRRSSSSDSATSNLFDSSCPSRPPSSIPVELIYLSSAELLPMFA